MRILWNLLLATPAVLSIGFFSALPAFAEASLANLNAKGLSPANSDSVDPSTLNSNNQIALDQIALNQAEGLEAVSAIAPSSLSSTLISSAPPSSDLLQQYTQEGQSNAIGQVTSVNQLSDVRPTDWAFEALSRLIENYGCIAGYPDGTYRGNRALTRYEFAAGLNACLDALAERVGQGGVSQEDLDALRRLVEEFRSELATLRGRVDNLEARTTELEANQFSTTTKLNGDVLLYLADIFGGDAIVRGSTIDIGESNSAVLQSRVRLTFDTSFTGRDRLRTRLQFGNFLTFTQPGNEARFAGELNTNGNVVLDDLSYLFPVGPARVQIFANAGGLDALVFGNVITPFDLAAARGSISRFGQRPPIYRVANTNAGAAVNIPLVENRLSFQLGYSAGEANDPGLGSGLFNGNYGLIGQLTARNLFGLLDLGLTYVNSYTGTVSTTTNGVTSITAGVRTGTGSQLAAVDADRPTVANSYGVQANLKISPSFQIGGWAGFSAVRAIGLGDADVWNYGLTLAFPDLGAEGNLGGIVVGVEPRLTGASSGLASVLGRRSDPDTGLHIEGFYRLALNDNIDITPGIIWLTAPNHNSDNDDIFVGLIRTTIRF